MVKSHKESNALIIVSIILLLLGLLYIVEVNFVIQRTFAQDRFKKEIDELLLANQSLVARTWPVGEDDIGKIKERFNLTEIKHFTYLEPQTSQFSSRDNSHFESPRKKVLNQLLTNKASLVIRGSHE